MLNFIKNFRNDEDGAVTVDWVVLTAAIVGLGIAVLATVGGKTVTAADTTGDAIAAVKTDMAFGNTASTD